jgi:hypothetical protein
MRSIVEQVPTKVLNRIFECLEALLRERPDAQMQHFGRQSEGVTWREPDAILTCGFARYRLVSRQWKEVADTFFFREVGINLDFDPVTNPPPGLQQKSTFSTASGQSRESSSL